MNLFKLLIPKEKAQEVTECESFTVSWWVKTGWGNDEKHRAKVFVTPKDANEFQRQLQESALFIGAWIRTELTRN